ncbi:MAG: hypothetical protein IIC12_00470 [Proteobacteria bacterium]|nr:hypothetical protein [Pseudomonadota bacterium]
MLPHTGRRELPHGLVTPPGDPGPFAHQFIVPKGQLIGIRPLLTEQAQELVAQIDLRGKRLPA